MTINSRAIIFSFKGNRNYIQGPDIYNKMISEYRPSNPISIKFSVHGFIDKASCNLIEFSNKSELADASYLKARCQFESHEKTHYLGLIERETVDTDRYDYDEDKITQYCTIDGDKIELTQSSPYTFVETIVAMNKFHLNSLFPNNPGKWVFTRLDLNKDYNANSNISLIFRHNMNFRLTKSDVLINNEKVGDIYFSLVHT